MRTWSEDHPKARLLERKQEAIKVAARELFLQHGYANTTMEMVAARAGVSIMTLYRHFRSKDILFQAMIEHLCCHQAKPARETFWVGSPAEVLHRLGQVRLSQILDPDEIALYRVIIGAQEQFPEVGQMYYHLRYEKVVEPLSRYFTQLDQQGSLHIPDPASSARVFLSLLQGTIIERLRLGVEPMSSDEEISKHIEACVAFFLAAHRPAERAPEANSQV
ncbi:TetR family transcriptional regulator [Ktedonosporobacter rubrisoli]|uniref:TetR family transcriptional regulator n=1 Tax=Ktedonosporobacter rubrisoli TaxID=2509675 RepID=A0A4P6JX22_KTERU|nr:TetR/AcrR family transcriptional regulator [Ktedonosporobacter rubrisoli]QBD80287.1 TetR family transcriptional regulator [Ktedonosporobacter rubrisoli]